MTMLDSPRFRRGLTILILVAAALLCASVWRAFLSWDAAEYTDTAYHVADGDGWVTNVVGNSARDVAGPSKYPPGFPALLAPFAAIDHIHWGGRLLSFLYVVALMWAARAIGGWWASTLAGVFALTSPFLAASAKTVMSDATGAALALVVLAAFAKGRGRRWALLAGAAAGFGPLVRTAALPLLIAAVLAANRGSRRWVVLGAAPFVVALLIYQQWAYGSPFSSGYDKASVLWSTRWIFESQVPSDMGLQLGTIAGPLEIPYRDLPGWLYWTSGLGVWWAFAPPMVGMLGLLGICRRWGGRWGDPSARFAVLATLGTLAILLPYYYHGQRLIAAPAAIMVVYAAVWLADLFPSRGETPRHPLEAGGGAFDDEARARRRGFR